MLLRIRKKAVVKTTEITELIIASPSELAFFDFSRSVAKPDVDGAMPRKARSKSKPELALAPPASGV
jgi:hypothetical protein